MKNFHVKNRHMIGLVSAMILWLVYLQILTVTGRAQAADRAAGVLPVSAAFSPDGKLLAFAEADGKIGIWDLTANKRRLALPAQGTGRVERMAFDANGGQLAGTDGSAIRVWDAGSGKVLLTVPATAPIGGLAFRPDAGALAAVDENGQLAVVDAKSGKLALQTPFAEAKVTALAYSPDGTLLAAADENAALTLADAETGALIQQIPTGQDSINALAFSPNGKALATGSRDGQTVIWRVSGGQETARWTAPSPVNGVAFAFDGGKLALGEENAQIALWNGLDQSADALTGHQSSVQKVAFNSGSKTMASLDSSGHVIVWNVSTGQPQGGFTVAAAGGNANVNNLQTLAAVSVPGDAAPAATTHGPNQGRVNANGKNRKVPASARRNPRNWRGVTALTVSKDGSLLAGSTKDGRVEIWTANGAVRLNARAHHGAAVTGVVFSADAKEIISAGRDTEIQIRGVANGRQTRTLQGHEHPIRTVAASANGVYLASAGEETRIMLWDAKAGKLKNILNAHSDFVNALCFSADGKRLASGGDDGRVLWWDLEKGTVIHTLLGHAGDVNTVACSPNGKQIASGGTDSAVILWDTATGKQLARFAGHQAAVRAVAFDAQGLELASTGEDSKVLVWNTTTLKAVSQITGSTQPVNALAYTPSGDIVIGGEDDSVTKLNTDTGQTIQSIDAGADAAPAIQPESGAGAASVQAGMTVLDMLHRAIDWLVPAAQAAIPEPPGGPILIVTTSSDPFGKYYAEILRTEGLNEFAMADIATVNAATLAAYDVVILSTMTLSASQVSLFENWVNAGGNLIAMRPDAKLANLMGIGSAGSALTEGSYLKIDTSKAPGNGIAGQTLQIHGPADRYSLAGAASLADLYSDMTTATGSPALTLRNVGANGGQAAAFAFDFARSIIYTRQGNPTWATLERDGFLPIRSDDKFYGAADGDAQPDWIDFNRLTIPQADEQQRLLANLILEMNRDRKPLPRFWYFPRGEKAVVIMTGDDHANNGTQGRFDYFKAMSPAGCSVANWECVRGTSYIFPNTPLSDAQAAAYNADGFEVGLHLNTNCADFTPSSLRNFYTQQISDFAGKYPSLPAPITQRHHCIAWSDWVTGAVVQLENGIRLDTSYYYWPPGWVQNRPGFFTGSGMPMRFVNLDGSLIDVYNASSHMTDESGQTYPFTIDSFLDMALGGDGYYSAFTINAHTDIATIPEATTTVESALARSVPIVSSKQMLDWLDGRNASSFGALSWNGNSLNFTVARGADANGLQAMVPLNARTGALAGISGPGGNVQYNTQAVKGIQYAFFNAAPGNYTATYQADTAAPTVTATSPANGATGVSQQPAVTATFSEAIDPATLTTATFQLQAGSNSPVSAAVSYDAGTRTAKLVPNTLLAVSTVYTARLQTGIRDTAGNPLAAAFSWTFTTTATQPCLSAPCSAWNSSTTPGTLSANDTGSVELGVKFRSDLDGRIAGIRFYQANPGTYVAALWSGTGQQLGTATVNATAGGWQQADFSNPVSIVADTVYVASYHATNGRYAADNNYFTNNGVDNAPIHLLRDGENGGNGLYAYSAGTTFPANTFMASNYWVDVAFETSGGGADTTPPTVTGQSPASGVTGIATTAAVTATFSEAMDPASITAASFQLQAGGNPAIAATVSYANNTATLTPSAALTPNTLYTATVRGGASGVRDEAGNPLAANFTWSFTTGSGGGTACAGTSSLWPANPTPAVVSDSDTASVELGVKFRPSVNGFICGIRFYKGPSNAGTHIGKLWSGAGVELARATFQNETASGWQQVTFAAPVAVTANTTYVASYLAPAGRYSVNENYFTANVTSGALTALGSAQAGGNGVYQYGSGGFPTDSYLASNYWVDVLFATSTGTDTTPPTVSSTVPAANATGVGPTSTVNAVFSEAMDPASITAADFQLQAGGNPAIAAAVSYANNTATLTPSAALAANTRYTATVRGGASGVRDAAGNPLAADFTWTFTTGANACSAGGNAIVCENALAGNPASEWDISGAGDASIQGFTTDISVNKGGTVNFKISTPAAAYRLDIYRMGYYGGNGARKVATVNGTGPRNRSGADPASCLTDTTGLVDCGNWSVSSSWQVPADAVSGIYFAKAVRTDTGGASHIVFVVRDDSSTSAMLFQTSDTTWQAYNDYGGNSLYGGTGPGSGGNSNGRAYKVSYNRPFNTRGNDNGQDWVFNSEYPMVRWLEANGYDVSYFTGIDSDRRGNLIRNHKVFLSVGHDEYWSNAQRANVETARDAGGVHLAFFSGNEIFWKTRWENSIDGSNTANRTLVCYKETHNFPNNTDPSSAWTGTWRDPRGTDLNPPKTDGGRPENAFSGPIFAVNDGASTGIVVPEADGKMRFWRNTSIATLAAGTVASLPNGTLGYEWDEDLDNGFRPAGLVRLSTTVVNNAPVLTDFGSTFASGTANHAMTLYRANSGALVFGAGTMQWPWGLDSNHDRAGTPTDARMQQATVNLFADMNVQPGSLQAGLQAATASTDTAPPVSTIAAPASGATVTPGSTVTISGSATDNGGRVGSVEVSVDGGATWHPANGRGSWTYSWTVPVAPGTVNIKTRAADDSGNREIAGAGRNVTIGSGGGTACAGTSSLWPANPTPAVVSDSDTASVELGVKFRPSVNGFICGIRFYKGPSNAGTHIGKLWSGAGVELARATFQNETASGWQQVNFAAPVAVTANTTYVASYLAPAGRYSVNENYFTANVTSGALTALGSAQAGGNGVYQYGSGGFPTDSYLASNYWVDVLFATSISP